MTACSAGRAHTNARPSGCKTHFCLSCDSFLLNPPVTRKGCGPGIQWRKAGKSHRSYMASRALSRKDLIGLQKELEYSKNGEAFRLRLPLFYAAMGSSERFMLSQETGTLLSLGMAPALLPSFVLRERDG
jgi:hypothetical protein